MLHETIDFSSAAEELAPSVTFAGSQDFVFVSAEPAVRFSAEGCCEVLRCANRLLEDDTYRWKHVAGFDTLLNDSVNLSGQTLVLVGGTETLWRPDRDTLRAIRTKLRTADHVCVIGSGVFIPVLAGIRQAHQIAVHPNFRPAIAEISLFAEISQDNFCHSRSLSSATTGIAGMQMMVELVARQSGEFTANALAEYLGFSSGKSLANSPAHWRYLRQAKGNSQIANALQVMSEHLEDTLSVRQIADVLDVSPRQLERSFSEFLNFSPLKVYRDLRLERARQLVVQTCMPLSEIAVASGFTSASNFAKWFRHRFQESPNETRKSAYCDKPNERDAA